jgi:hypothetical protein
VIRSVRDRPEMRVAIGVGALLLGLLSCQRKAEKPTPTVAPSAGTVSERPPWLAGKAAPAVPNGMVWIPKGALVVGTPPDRQLRIADQEMPGEQLILEGFFIDTFAYPNEAAAIPQTNVTLDEAQALCVERGKRLCSELEWERACKGPNNTDYEYGNRYRTDLCGTGNPAQMLPSGLRFGCRSEFGVRDLHGSVWEWTDSPWGRGGPAGHVSIRGGNDLQGEVVGRCANARSRSPKEKASEIGFRCCMGERNAAEVVLQVSKGQSLEYSTRVETSFANTLRETLPEEASKALGKSGPFKVERMWTWRPIGNETLTVAAGCAARGVKQVCGAVVGRKQAGKWQPLLWVDSGHFTPVCHLDYDPRHLWLYGGDAKAHYRRRISYRWGMVQLADIQRNPRPRGE